jgi:hypothetical protein
VKSNFIGFVNESPDGISNTTGPYFFSTGERLVVTGSTSGQDQPMVCTMSGFLIPVDTAPER